jgi:polysaccharide deacetylase family protein (PEP-CTERM system associated)
MITNALSVDVEEYYHSIEFETAFPGEERQTLPSRVEESTEQVLILLSTLGVRATFFTVGQIAEAHPELIRQVSEAGHEIACHSYRHELVSRQSPDEFRCDLQRAKGILEDLTGEEIIGYRAPNYSIGVAQAWAYDILLEEGFLYDSSIYPIVHDRYGWPNAPRFPHEIRTDGSRKLIEFPIGTTCVLGKNLPIGGGGYFRLLPVGWFQNRIQRVNKHEGQPVMFYFHPWELDPQQPYPSMPWYHSLRHYVGIEGLEAKLRRLLQDCHFSTVREVLGLQKECEDLLSRSSASA